MNICILGGGSWGTAMAIHLCSMDHQVRLYVRDKAQAEQMRLEKKNPDYLGDTLLPDTLQIFTSPEEALSGADVVMGAIPAQAMESFYKSFPGVLAELPFISLSKGITTDRLETMEQLYKRYYPQGTFAALSGPSHAEEVARKVPTALVLACDNEAFSRRIQKEFSNEFIRIYRSSDVLGVELAGAFKNVIALVVGMAHGCGLGDNTKAALMTRGMAEISRLALAMGAKQETFLGLSGFGDLIVTCTSSFSRNRRAGELLAQGLSEEEVKNKIGMVIEGLTTLRSVIRLAKKYHQSMPIAETLERVLSGKLPIDEAMRELMMRDYKEEI